MNIRKNDNVLVLAGKDKGKKAKVRFANPVERKVIVEGVNIIKKHSRGAKGARQAGIIEREAPINASNVMIICNKCNQPTRIGRQFLEGGKKVRVCRACKEVIDQNA
ncbi:MAG: 50S ribosomal protein L24 [Chloroflexi bacterium]|nr:50S ribosomal protein L24 [Chloroflexota bacterium]